MQDCGAFTFKWTTFIQRSRVFVTEDTHMFPNWSSVKKAISALCDQVEYVTEKYTGSNSFSKRIGMIVEGQTKKHIDVLSCLKISLLKERVHLAR